MNKLASQANNTSNLPYNQVSLIVRGEFLKKNIIGERLREARLKARPKVTQLDLLARLELREIYLEKTSISKIEAGTRPVTDKELVAIAEALSVTPHWLLKVDT